MTKENILELIKKVTVDNNGNPPSIEKFLEHTGIKRSTWEGKYWIRWNDALKEAGLNPNEFGVAAYEMDYTLERVSQYIIELGHFPSQPEFKIKNHQDKTFPTLTTIKARLGNKAEIASKILAFCENNESYVEAINICNEVLKSSNKEIPISTDNLNLEIGYVYLMKSGKFYKIGKAKHTGVRNYQLSIQLPEKITIVHEIQTDDPFGIEEYWHKRFESKRKNGEWFELNATDIAAFKRRKFM